MQTRILNAVAEAAAAYAILTEAEKNESGTVIKVKLPAASRGAALVFLPLDPPREGNSKDAIMSGRSLWRRPIIPLESQGAFWHVSVS